MTQNIIPKIKTALAVLIAFIATDLYSQNEGGASLHGNFQTDVQYYFEDTLIGAPEFPQKIGSNSFLYMTYNKGSFRAGLRMEGYLPTLQGYFREDGIGVGHAFANYSTEKIDVTLGSFYEQFGSGMVLRTYEEWGLGFDNSLNGARVKVFPTAGVDVTGFVAKQRTAFTPTLKTLSDGILRGADANASLNEIIPALDTAKARISIGASFVSRYQEDRDPLLNLPENVAAWSGRANLVYGDFSLGAEYVYKYNDPSNVNDQIFKSGTGILLQSTYSQKGLGISLGLKRIDNMDFRSERSGTFNNLNVNFLPPQTKQHTYRLPTLFPWATQPLGEFAGQLEVLYRIKRGSKIGGKYGTNITFNFSRIHGLNKTPTTNPYDGYTTGFFDITDKPLFQDVNIEITRKLNKKMKVSFSYLYFIYNESLFKQLTGFPTTEDVTSHVQVLDFTYKFPKRHILRTELQHAYTKQEFGSWAMLLLEYNIGSHWFIALFDEYNYGNADPAKRLHYYSANAGLTIKDYRVTLGYGRQRAGVLCVGGVCRFVPAANGFTLSVNANF